MSINTSGDRAYASFLVEAPELLQQIERDLFSLREECSLNKVHNLMRTTHTLKGVAASVGLESLKQVAHSLEDVFKALYNPTVAIDAQIEALLFQSYECLRLPVSAELTRATWNESEVLDRAAVIFDRLQEKLGCVGEEGQLPTAEELGVDITQSIFAHDVGDRLTVLADAIAQQETARVAETLQKQATVFLGLAEALDLPSFGAIAQTALASLNAFPDRAITIAQLALADWQQVRSAILAGEQQGTEADESGLQSKITPLASTEDTSAPQWLQNPKSKIHNSLTPYPLPLTPSLPTVRVDWQQLEHLNTLVTDLLTHQTQQGANEQQFQVTIQKLQQQLQQHQQTLNCLQNWTNWLLAHLVKQQDLVSKTQVLPHRELIHLFQSAQEETQKLTDAIAEVTVFHQASERTSIAAQQLLSQVQVGLGQARNLALGDVFIRLQQGLQQLADAYGKPTQLQQSGTEILVDKAIADKLYEILLHLVRNAFDHGIESPAVRRQLGKPPIGQIRLAAHQQEQWTIIEIGDDGKGLDWEKIIERALAMNLLTWEQTMSLSQTELSNILFIPGFSTATQISDLSGRGLGLDVVRAQLELLQGEIALKSEPHQGTTFTLRLPRHLTCFSSREPVNSAMPKVVCSSTMLAHGNARGERKRAATIAIEQMQPENFSPWIQSANPLEWTLKTNALFVWLTKAAVFVLPYANIAECVVPEPKQIGQIQQQRFLTWRGQKIPLYSLTQALHYNHSSHSSLNLAVDDAALTLVIQQEKKIFALQSTMQRLVTETEIAIAPCDRSIAFPSYIYGCTWQDSRLLLAIDVMSLLAQQTTQNE